jgi:hypothetical protein
VLLADQDRSTWDRPAIDTASHMVESILRRRKPGVYQNQAAIACLHSLAPSFEETDWPMVVELYDELLDANPSPVVALNRAIAIAMADGAEAGIAVVRESHPTPLSATTSPSPPPSANSRCAPATARVQRRTSRERWNCRRRRRRNGSCCENCVSAT